MWSFKRKVMEPPQPQEFMSPIELIRSELYEDIKAMGAVARLKLLGELDMDFNIRSVSAYNDEMWKMGFERCLAEVERLIGVISREED